MTSPLSKAGLPFAAIALAMVCASCTDTPPTAPRTGLQRNLANASTMSASPHSLTWHFVTGIAGGSTSSVWAAASNDIWASGGYRTLVHFDGSTWTQAVLPAAANQYDVWGLGPNDVYTAGQYGYQTGQILHWDGHSWTSMYVTNNELIAIWGTSPGNLYAVGDGRLVHYDGATWTDIPTGLSTAFNVDRLQGIWGDSAANSAPGAQPDVWMVGYHGRIMHYDGTSVSTVVELPSETFSAIDGTGARDIFAVGSSGLIYHYDGRQWSPMQSGTSTPLFGVFAINRHDAYAAGDSGTVLHYNGRGWSPVSSGTFVRLGGVYALSRDQVYIGTIVSNTEGALLMGSAAR